MIFSDRVKLAEKYDKWLKENPVFILVSPIQDKKEEGRKISNFNPPQNPSLNHA